MRDTESFESSWRPISTVPINAWVLTPPRYSWGGPPTVVKYVDGRFFQNSRGESIITPEAWMPIPEFISIIK